MIKQTLPKKAISVWRFRCTFFLCIASFICGAIGVVDVGICTFLLFILFLSYLHTVLFYLQKRYLSQNYIITKNKICIEKGAYFKVKKIIPVNKIQYIEIKISPDEKFWNLCTIIFFAAGTKITIPQIEYPKALKIKKSLNLEDKNEI